MNTENIVKFLQTDYTAEKLAALLAHAQDGKLGFGSCCCLVGIPTADHALQDAPGLARLQFLKVSTRHYFSAKRSDWERMCAVEDEFYELGVDDEQRRLAIIPLILAEMDRREKAEQLRLESIDAEREGTEIYTSGYPIL